MTNETKSAVLERPSAKRKLAAGGIFVLVLAIGFSIAAAKGVFNSSATNTAAHSPDCGQECGHAYVSATRFRGASAGIKAIKQAAADNKYLFAFFWSSNNDQTAAMRKVFEQATAKVTDRAQAVAVRVSDPAERGIVKKFDLDRAPMPLVLAIAPNGAIMGGFPTKFEERICWTPSGRPALSSA